GHFDYGITGSRVGGEVAAGIASGPRPGVEPAAEAVGVPPFELVEHALPQVHNRAAALAVGFVEQGPVATPPSPAELGCGHLVERDPGWLRGGWRRRRTGGGVGRRRAEPSPEPDRGQPRQEERR